jgi:hypothetical protein
LVVSRRNLKIAAFANIFCYITLIALIKSIQEK